MKQCKSDPSSIEISVVISHPDIMDKEDLEATTDGQILLSKLILYE